MRRALVLCAPVLIAGILSGCGNSSNNGSASATAGSKASLEQYFAQFCGSFAEIRRRSESIATPVPTDVAGVARYIGEFNQLLAELIARQAQIEPPQSVATTHAELLAAEKDVSTATAEERQGLLEMTPGIETASQTPAYQKKLEDAQARSSAATKELLRLAAEQNVRTDECQQG
jgi:outer membrane PBP1 activator LpoA protein